MLEKSQISIGYDIGVISYYDRNTHLSVSRYRTNCCALGQLSLNNDHPQSLIKEVIEEIKNEVNNVGVSPMSRLYGERAIFVSVLIPGEEILEKNLIELGFKYIYEFHRRAVYGDEKTMIRMYIYSW